MARTVARPHYLTVRDLAERLELSEQTIRRYLKIGHLPHIRLPGGQIRVDPEVFEIWLAEHNRGGKR